MPSKSPNLFCLLPFLLFCSLPSYGFPSLLLLTSPLALLGVQIIFVPLSKWACPLLFTPPHDGVIFCTPNFLFLTFCLAYQAVESGSAYGTDLLDEEIGKMIVIITSV
jgi:hypothetical protein